MNKSQTTLVKRLIENTSAFKCGNISFEKKDDYIIILDANKDHPAEVFYAAYIAGTMELAGFSTYIQMNKEKNRLELRVY
jgi:intein-encoded DNA endonuclease-like protein